VSEYQYYEFAALDHVLDRRQQLGVLVISGNDRAAQA
jgi:hypothetical protein